jgi:hypothetical protein
MNSEQKLYYLNDLKKYIYNEETLKLVNSIIEDVETVEEMFTVIKLNKEHRENKKRINKRTNYNFS